MSRQLEGLKRQIQVIRDEREAVFKSLCNLDYAGYCEEVALEAADAEVCLCDTIIGWIDTMIEENNDE